MSDPRPDSHRLERPILVGLAGGFHTADHRALVFTVFMTLPTPSGEWAPMVAANYSPN